MHALCLKHTQTCTHAQRYGRTHTGTRTHTFWHRQMQDKKVTATYKVHGLGLTHMHTCTCACTDAFGSMQIAVMINGTRYIYLACTIGSFSLPVSLVSLSFPLSPHLSVLLFTSLTTLTYIFEDFPLCAVKTGIGFMTILKAILNRLIP